MFEFILRQEIGMAGKANLPLRGFHPHCELGQVARVALSIFVGRMGGEARGRKRHQIRKDKPVGIERLAVFIILDSGRAIGLARRRHAIKEEIQPFLLLFRAAPDQDRQTAKSRQGRAQEGPGAGLVWFWERCVHSA
jgi:hypothetical protein